MTLWKKIKSFTNSKAYSKVMILYIFIVGTLILVTAETKLDYVLALFNYFLGFLVLYMLIVVNRRDKLSQRILNYINIYKNLPPETILEREEKLYNIEKRLVIENYECLFNKHDVIVYCVINPDTVLTKYFEKHDETLNFNFFKNKFIVIDESGLFTFKKQYDRI